MQHHFPEQNPQVPSVKTQNSQVQILMSKYEARHPGGSENIGVWKYAVHGQKKWLLSSSMCNNLSFDILNMDTPISSQMFTTINQTTWHYIPHKDGNHHSHLCKVDLTFDIMKIHFKE
jgi:hypothetical protein